MVKRGLTMPSHFPPWMHRKLPTGGKMAATKEILTQYGLHTICQSAICPNQGECLASGTATFLILGDHCTRNCAFCAVSKGVPSTPDPDEPEKIAQAVAALKLRHAVITSVTRDDLPDGGAGHFAATLHALRQSMPATTIEVLTPDFRGQEQAIDTVIAAMPNVYNHNIETVERLYDTVRPGAKYSRSLRLLEHVKEKAPGIYTKSGLMLGLGENANEVVTVLRDLRDVGCDIITIGQYLQPSPLHLPVQCFIPPEEFAAYKEAAVRLGFTHVESGPFVRSSYHAHELWDSKASENAPGLQSEGDRR
jgi:lipoic acid synthetase